MLEGFAIVVVDGASEMSDGSLDTDSMGVAIVVVLGCISAVEHCAGWEEGPTQGGTEDAIAKWGMESSMR